MKTQTKKQLKAKREAVVKQLVARGIDYQEARFMVMTAGAKPEGLLAEQPSSDEVVPEIDQDLLSLTSKGRQENNQEQRITYAAISEAHSRIDNQKGTRADYDLMVTTGLAHYNFDEDDRPNGFEWTKGQLAIGSANSRKRKLNNES